MTTLREFLKCSLIPKYELTQFLKGIETGIENSLEGFSGGDQVACSDDVYFLSKGWDGVYSKNRNSVFTPFLESLITKEVSKSSVAIPIEYFFGSWPGKSDSHASLKDFAYSTALSDSLGSYKYTTTLDWLNNTKSIENEIKCKGKISTAIYCEWSKKLYLSNPDYSHRFAAVYRQAIEQNRSWSIDCRIEFHHLNTKKPTSSNDAVFITRGELNESDRYFRGSNKLIKKLILDDRPRLPGRESTLFTIAKLNNISEAENEVCMRYLNSLHSSKKICLLHRVKERLPKPLDSGFLKWYSQ